MSPHDTTRAQYNGGALSTVDFQAHALAGAILVRLCFCALRCSRAHVSGMIDRPEDPPRILYLHRRKARESPSSERRPNRTCSAAREGKGESPCQVLTQSLDVYMVGSFCIYIWYLTVVLGDVFGGRMALVLSASRSVIRLFFGRGYR